jgi:ribose transport system permease protein
MRSSGRVVRSTLASGVPQLRDVYPFLILVVCFGGLLILPGFYGGTVGTTNIYNVLQTFADYGLVALAIGLVMIAGEYDLSTAGAYAAAAVVAVKLGADSALVGALAAVGLGLVAGTLQGTVITRLNVSSVPVTLGGYLTLVGVTYVVSDNKAIDFPDISVSTSLDQPVLSIFSPRSLIVIGLFVAAALILRFTRWGPELRSVGGDRRAARTAGVRAGRVVAAALIASGALSALGGALSAYSLAAANPDVGLTPLIFGTIAALLGGVSLAGGRGTAAGIAAGVLAYAAIRETLAIIGAEAWISDVVTGCLLLIVTILTAPELARQLRVGRSRLGSRRALESHERAVTDG